MKRRVLSFVIFVMMCLSLVPLQALAGTAVTAKYLNATGWGDGDPTGIVLSDSFSSEDTVAMYLFGNGTYTVSQDVPVLLVGGGVNAVLDGATPERFCIARDGSVQNGNIVIFPGSYTVCYDGSNDDADQIIEFFDSEQWDHAVYSYEITGSYALDYVLEAYDVTVDADAELSLKVREDGYARLVINHTLTVADGATIIGEDNSEYRTILEIRENSESKVTGIALYSEGFDQLPDPFEDAREAGTFEFSWINTAQPGETDNYQWALFPGGSEPGGLEDGQFTVDYDDRGGQASVKIGEVIAPAWETQEFTKNKSLSFTLIPPADGGEYVPVVEIELMDEHEEAGDPNPIWIPNTILSSIGETPDITLDGNSFFYTPTSETPFIVRVWWSQDGYEFSQIKGKYAVEFSVEGNGTVTVDGVENQITCGNRTKVAWNDDPGNVVFTITPNGEEDALESVWIEQESNGDDNYNALLCGESAYKDGKLDISQFEDVWGSFVNVSFRFTGAPQPVPAVEDGHYTVEYDDWYDSLDESYGASVTVGESDVLRNGDIREFTAHEGLSIKLTPPEEWKDAVPIVEIEAGGECWRTVDIDDGHRIMLTDNSFTFTPASETGFVVRIWWSDYERFGPQSNEFMIETDVDGNGSITADKENTSQQSCNGTNRGKKCYTVGNDVTLTFVPDEGSELLFVFIGFELYTNENEEGSHPLSDLLNAENGKYQYTITGEEYEYFYIEAHFSGDAEEATTELQTGDVNNDGEVDALDATQITRYSNGKSSVFGSTSDKALEEARLKAGDVNNDGEVDALDATQITRYSNGKPSIFDKMTVKTSG